MSQRDKLLAKILLGASGANIPFESLCQLLRTLGFDERIQGSHHIFSKERVVGAKHSGKCLEMQSESATECFAPTVRICDVI
jgi:predicted RNA binding protein YcfA (HicA-like mRNA interferase family)